MVVLLGVMGMGRGRREGGGTGWAGACSVVNGTELRSGAEATDGSGARDEPVLFQPGTLRLQGLAPAIEGAEHRPQDGPQVGAPAAVGAGLDVAGAADD